MTWIATVVPVLGIIAAISVPMVRYAAKERHERAAIATLERVQQAQREFRSHNGAYATEAASLVTPCPGERPLLAADEIGELNASGYSLSLRAAVGAAVSGSDCGGRAVATDFYAAVAPMSVTGAAQQAFAVRGGGPMFLLYDGIAPSERDIEAGLATPVAARESFRIP